MTTLDRHPFPHAPYCGVNEHGQCDCYEEWEPDPPEPDNPAEDAWHDYADAEARSRDDGGSRED